MAVLEPLLPDEFFTFLEARFSAVWAAGKIAVGVSGGPDSIALARLLVESGKEIHILSVDHGLREESAQESAYVGEVFSRFDHAVHHVLKWEGDKPDNKIQEEARHARYDLMAQYCHSHGISFLLLAHHADDQLETVLFRLSKGSGLDGLCGMRPVQSYDESLSLVRPFLDVEKSRLIKTCEHYGIDFLRDPTNESIDYARPRMRAAREVLEAEGLTAKRAVVTAKRLQRAHDALDQIAAKAFAKFKTESGGGLHLMTDFLNEPEDIAFRVLLKAIEALRPDENYLPRMEKIEDLFSALCHSTPFRKRTLGGLVFERDDQSALLSIKPEGA